MTPKRLNDLVEYHKKRFQDDEAADFRQAVGVYNGDWSVLGEDFDGDVGMGPNWIYPVTENAVTALTAGNPLIGVVPDAPGEADLQLVMTSFMTKICRTVEFAEKSNLSLCDAMLKKRSIFKRGWDFQKPMRRGGAPGRPTLAVIRPELLFFNLDVRMRDDIRYWLECVPVPKDVFARMVKTGQYNPKFAPHGASAYPSWIPTGEKDGPLNGDEYVQVWEYYDLVNAKVYHWADGMVIGQDGQSEGWLCEFDMEYDPYEMYSLNHNGVDCRGLSEVKLILRQQVNLNTVHNVITNIIMRMIPGIVWDAGAVDETDIENLNAADTPSHTLVKMKDDTKRFQEAYVQKPMPTLPGDIPGLTAMIEKDISNVTAFAEIQRGRSGGFRSATEAAIADANIRSRIAAKESRFSRAVGRVGDGLLELCARFMPEAQMVKMGTTEDWKRVDLDMLRNSSYYCEMGLISPARRNPAMFAETLLQNLQVLATHPNVNQEKLIQLITEAIGAGTNILLTAKEKEKMAATMAQGMQPGAPQGAPPAAASGAPPMPADASAALGAQPSEPQVTKQVVNQMGLGG